MVYMEDYMITLAIYHGIHLNREERYALHAGHEITTVGVSIPIWFKGKVTSEPCKEVFCRYVIRNPKKDMPIQILQNGYEIPIPYREGYTPTMSDEEWRKTNMEAPEKLEQFYGRFIPEVSSVSLLDPCDGGTGSLAYREQNKVKREKYEVTIIHYVCFDSRERLCQNLELSRGSAIL